MPMLRDEKVELAPPPAEYDVRIIHAMCPIAQTGEGCASILFMQAKEKFAGASSFWREIACNVDSGKPEVWPLLTTGMGRVKFGKNVTSPFTFSPASSKIKLKHGYIH